MGSEREQLTLIGDLSVILERGASVLDQYAVRSVVEVDKLALAKLYHDSYSRDLVADIDDANEEMEKTFRGEYGLLAPDASLVVVDRERPLGSILTVEEAPWPRTPSGPFVIELFVHPGMRRRGLAQHMVVAAAHALRRRGKSTAALRVLSDNTAALCLYERLGFKRAEEM